MGPFCTELGVRSVAVASRPRQSETVKSSKLESNELVSNMQIWEGLSVQALCTEQWRRVTDN